MELIIDSIAGQTIVTSRDGKFGFWVIAGGVTCDKNKTICFGNYVINPTENDIELVESAELANGFTLIEKALVITSMKDRLKSSLNKLGS